MVLGGAARQQLTDDGLLVYEYPRLDDEAPAEDSFSRVEASPGPSPATRCRACPVQSRRAEPDP